MFETKIMESIVKIFTWTLIGMLGDTVSYWADNRRGGGGSI